MNTSRNTWENWENDNYKKATFRTKTSLDKMTLQWTAHLHQETAQFPPGPSGEGPMEVGPDARRRMRGKTGTVSASCTTRNSGRP